MSNFSETSLVRGKVTAQPDRSRINDPEGTRRNIIEVATREFAENGLAGARIDEIAAKTKSSKRMIYYYFGDKEGLYLSALEEAYKKVRAIEANLRLDDLDPVDALRRLTEFTFDHDHEHEDFVRMVMIENTHRGQYLERSEVIRETNDKAIDQLRSLYARGVAEGHFRDGLDVVDIHWQISALCFFSVSNRASFSLIFDRDLASRPALDALRGKVIDMVLRYVMQSDKLPTP